MRKDGTGRNNRDGKRDITQNSTPENDTIPLYKQN